MAVKWTKKLEKELQDGIKKGLKPAISENKKVLCCNKEGCNHVAWECFSVQSINLKDGLTEDGDLRGDLLIEVYCSLEHQTERLMTIDNYLMEKGE